MRIDSEHGIIIRRLSRKRAASSENRKRLKGTFDLEEGNIEG